MGVLPPLPSGAAFKTLTLPCPLVLSPLLSVRPPAARPSLPRPCNQVYSVDCNPAQSALLELKQVAITRLGHDDVWRLFGEGAHPRAAALFERQLAPFLSQAAGKFWRPRLRYFAPGDSLYFHGGMVGSEGDGLVLGEGAARAPARSHARMSPTLPSRPRSLPLPAAVTARPSPCAQGKVVRFVRSAAFWLGMGRQWDALAAAPTLEAQRAAWEALWLVRALRTVPAWLAPLLANAAQLLCFNRLALWFGGGIPLRQVRGQGRAASGLQVQLAPTWPCRQCVCTCVHHPHAADAMGLPASSRALCRASWCAPTACT